jgi:hypothetical protein
MEHRHIVKAMGMEKIAVTPPIISLLAKRLCAHYYVQDGTYTYGVAALERNMHLTCCIILHLYQMQSASQQVDEPEAATS